MFQASRRKLIIPFLLPGVLFISIFYLLPAAQTVYVSFMDWNGIFQTNGFVGTRNYTKLFTDSLFVGSIKHTFLYFLISAVILFPAALVLAVSLHKIKKAKRFIQFVIFAPVVLSVVVAGVLWKFIYNPNVVLLNSVLNFAGLDSMSKAWLGESSTALISIVIASIWHGIGTWIILLMAGIDRVPTDLGEAARLDGATELQVFWHITLPLIWEVLRTLFVLCFVGAMQSFSFVFIMTKGGPHGSTEVMGTYLYKMAFEGNMFSYGAAMSIVMGLVIILFSFFGNKLMKRDIIEY